MTAAESFNRPPYPLVAFNKVIIKYGVQLPLHPLVRRVLAHFNLSPSQLNPNAYKVLAGDAHLVEVAVRGRPHRRGGLLPLQAFFEKVRGRLLLLGSVKEEEDNDNEPILFF